MICLFVFLTVFSGLPGSVRAEKGGNILTVGIPGDERCPVFYTDRDTGEKAGIGVDLILAAAEEAGYTVEFQTVKEASLKEALDNEAYDIVMPFGSAVPSASGQKSILTENLMETPFVFVSPKKQELPAIGNMKVGMLQSMSAGAETVQSMYPDMEINLYESMGDAVKALRSGKVDALLHNAYVWSYVMQKPSYSDLEVHPSSIFTIDFKAAAVDSAKSRELMARLNRGITAISDAQRQAIILDYSTRRLYKNDVFDYILQYGLVVGVFLVIICIIAIASYRLKRANIAAEEASKAKTMFLANMSHEIRTPLNSIMGMGELISRETADERLLQYAYSIKSSARSLLLLVNDILDFSRMEAGKLKLIDDLYHLSHLLTDVDTMIKPRAESKNLAYEVAVDPKTPETLVGDETRLKQVMINLLTNAEKYTKSGFVRLIIGYEKVDDIRIDLKITVKDSGMGMKQEEIDRLFKAFERLDEDKNRTIEGTGLGMSIVKQILDAMDSHLEIRSVYGAGSEFSFAVRQKVSSWEGIGDYEQTARKIVSRHEDYIPKFVAPEAKILVVDDTEINLKVVSGLLERTKMQVDTALSGKQALEMLKMSSYDLLLIDYRMPEMDGVELLHHIREDTDNPNHDHICIALTANVVEGGRKMYIDAGFDEYLEKPINSKRMEEALMQYLPRELLLKPGRPNDHSGAVVTPSYDSASGIDEDAQRELNRLQNSGVINIYEGIEYAGSRELYLQALRFFRDSVDAKAEEINRLYREENLTDYTTRVHGLKSAAKVVGAFDLSEKARLLEMAGKQEDMDYINANHEDLLKVYRQYKVILEKV